MTIHFHYHCFHSFNARVVKFCLVIPLHWCVFQFFFFVSHFTLSWNDTWRWRGRFQLISDFKKCGLRLKLWRFMTVDRYIEKTVFFIWRHETTIPNQCPCPFPCIINHKSCCLPETFAILLNSFLSKSLDPLAIILPSL